MQVHLASGTHPFPSPWWNVDISDGPGTDQVADLLDPLPSNLKDIHLAYIGHFLEHLSPDEGVEFLSNLLERMRPGGVLVVVGPDAERGRDMHREGSIPTALLNAILAHGYIPEGQPHNRGAIHLWDCTGHEVVDMLVKAGWNDAHEFPVGEMKKHAPGVPLIDGSKWQFAAVAVAPTGVHELHSIV